MKIIYIIPGLGEDCNLARYKKLTEVMQTKGYSVKSINPDWYKPLSEQVFPIEKESIIFGFSFGAILAYLIVRKYPCKKVIFGSISPIHTFSFKSLVDDNTEHMDKDLAIELARDIKNIKISLKDINTPHISLAGELEIPVMINNADLLVPKTKHFLSKAYIESINKLVE
jgi:alpha/beta superfamily hydrolase